MLCTDGVCTVSCRDLRWVLCVINGNTGVMTRRDQMADIPKRVCGEWSTKTWRMRRRNTTNPRIVGGKRNRHLNGSRIRAVECRVNCRGRG